jgi:hypothetical protein
MYAHIGRLAILHISKVKFVPCLAARASAQFTPAAVPPPTPTAQPPLSHLSSLLVWLEAA